MTTQISGDTGVSQCQPGSVSQDDLAANVVGKGPVFRATNSGTQAISENVFTKVNLATEAFDTDGAFASSRFTPQVAGYYQLNAITNGVASAAIISVGTAIYKNGTNDSSTVISGGISATEQAPLSTLVFLNGTTDYVELFCRIVGGTSGFTINSATFSGFLARAA